MDYVFISYSHSDSPYVRRLAASFEERRIPVWIDERIDYGTEWPNEIERQLDGCSALVLIMTPSARSSTWVQNELARATRKKKQVFPLLLDGDEPWLSVEALQYVDVRNGTLPSNSFFERFTAVPARSRGEKTLIYEADFSLESVHWTEGTSPIYKTFRRGDCYHIRTPVGKHERYHYTGFQLSDFCATVDAQIIPTNDTRAQCGIVFRFATSDSDDYYRFSISRNGEYALHVTQADEWTTIVDYTKNENVRTTGEFNTLAVKVQRSSIHLESNGVLLRTIDDYRLPAGQVGLFVASMTDGLCAEARFRQFRLHSLEE